MGKINEVFSKEFCDGFRFANKIYKEVLKKQGFEAHLPNLEEIECSKD